MVIQKKAKNLKQNTFFFPLFYLFLFLLFTYSTLILFVKKDNAAASLLFSPVAIFNRSNEKKVDALNASSGE